MKKIQITTAVLFLILGPVLIEACQSSVCECCDLAPQPYTIKDIFLMTTLDGADATMPTPHSAAPKKLRFFFNASGEMLSYRSEHQRSYKSTMAAYADCTTIAANTISKEKFASLMITSNAKLVTKDGRTFNPGDNMATLFLQNNFTLGSPLTSQSFNFAPVFSITQKTEQQFTFAITLDDGRKFTLLAGPFELLPD